MAEILELEPFQERGINNIALELTKVRNVLAVSPTGSGKGIMISAIVNRIIKKMIADNDEQGCIMIVVHKKELLNDIRNRLWKYFEIYSQKIDAKTTRIEPSRVYVAMVETFNRRTGSQNFLDKFKNVRYEIFDEAHLGNHRKLYMHFIDAKRIGFTATPISAVKKYPLNKDWNSIIIISTIAELIQLNDIKPSRGVVRWMPYNKEKNINRDEIKKKGDDFDEDDMGEKFSGTTQINNTVQAYIDHAYGKKTLVFCSNVKHSKLVNQAFLDAGFNSRHLDGSSPDWYRDETLGTPEKPGWIQLYPDAILCNVGIATIGTDIPSVECVILNSSMMSVTLLLQKLGRGGRPYQYPNGEYKKYFIMIDLGDNFEGGKMPWYDYPIDWKEMFDNPKLPKPGSAPTKTCPECGAMNYASARICSGLRIDLLTDEEIPCGYEFPVQESKEDLVPVKLKKMIQEINVQDCINFFKNTEYKERRSFWELIYQVCNIAWLNKPEESRNWLEPYELNYIVDMVKKKTKEWNKIMKKGRWETYNEDLRASIINNLKKVGFDITLEEYEKLLVEASSENLGVTL